MKKISIKHKKLFKFIVPVFTFIFCIICLELVLSFFYTKNDNYYVFQPGETSVHYSNTNVLRGVSDTINASYNSLGARSTEVPLLTHHKIVAFGGSTTKCVSLDQKDTWSEVLQTSLNKNSDSTIYWVGNFGKSGNSTNHNILQTEEVLQYQILNDVETVLYLVGYNDLINATRFTEKYINTDVHETRLSAFTIVPDKELPFYRKTSIWKFLKDSKRKLRLKQSSKEDIAEVYIESRSRRKKIKKNNILPDLTKGMHHYRENINALIRICKSKGKKPIFITQPVLWRQNITEEGEDTTNFFSNEKLSNLDTESLYKCMEEFNTALIEVCRKNDVKCIDLSKYSEENWFYDNCHYNIKGAKEVARIIYQNIDFPKK